MPSHGELALFSLGGSEDFGTKVADYLDTTKCYTRQDVFPDGELLVSPGVNVRGKDVFVIHSLFADEHASVNDKLMELAQFNNAAHHSSAGRVTNVVPYFPYLRQDRKSKPREPLSSQVVAHLLTGARWGADRILSLDWHSGAVQNAYNVPVDVLQPYNDFIRWFYHKLKDESKIVVLGPDLGAMTTRADELVTRLGGLVDGEVTIAAVDKVRRGGSKIESHFLLGDVEDAFVIIPDDESVTGGTIVNAAQKAKEKGAKSIWATLTHTKLTREGLERIQGSCLE